MGVNRNVIFSCVSACILLGCGGSDVTSEQAVKAPAETPVVTNDHHTDLSEIVGVQEIIVSVRDLDKSIAIYSGLGDWTVLARGDVDTGTLAQWKLADDMEAKYAVLSNAGHKWGFLRLVQFGDGTAPEIRPGARPFDSGGIFNINSFAIDIDATFDEMRQVGFVGFAEPSRYTLSFGEYAGAILSGPDGVVVNLLSRLSRGYDDFEPFSKMSNILNSTQVVDDFQKSAEFYQEKLGFEVKLEMEPQWRESGDNNFSLPNSIAQSGAVKQKAISLALDKSKTGGTIELLNFDGITGRDFSDRAIAPNRGVLMYGIHQNNLANYRTEIAANGVTTFPSADAPLSAFDLPPYGRVNAFQVKAPEGALMLFFEQVEQATE